MNRYYYYQLLNTNFDELVKGDDNPAGIADGTPLPMAKKLAREWMRMNGVKEATLVRNVLLASCDNIDRTIDLTI